MAVRTINKFIKPLQNSLFPALRNQLGMELGNTPIDNRATIATFAGTLSDNRVLLEFSSNHVELQQDLDRPVLFVKTFYGSGGNEAGVIDLNNIDEAVDQIYAALYELGYRSEQDLADEEAERQENERKAAEEKELQKQKEKEDKEKRRAELYAEEPNEEQADEEVEQEDYQESINESLELFDRYLNVLKDENAINSQIMISISISKGDNDFSILGINMFYISSAMCLVQTNKINPKIDKATSWEKAKDYCKKVAEKVEGTMSIEAVYENGADVNLPSEEPNNDTDVGIDI